MVTSQVSSLKPLKQMRNAIAKCLDKMKYLALLQGFSELKLPCKVVLSSLEEPLCADLLQLFGDLSGHLCHLKEEEFFAVELSLVLAIVVVQVVPYLLKSPQPSEKSLLQEP